VLFLFEKEQQKHTNAVPFEKEQQKYTNANSHIYKIYRLIYR